MSDTTITYIAPTKQAIVESDNSTTRKLRVAAYARVSTEQDEQQSSYEAQLDYYSTHIKSNPEWEFVEVFADEGITGTSTKHREGFNRMINSALNGEIDLILTKSISRFARNTVDTLSIVRQLKSAGVEVIFEKENLHTLDPKCEMMLTIFSSLAQEESRSISENVRWGQQKSMKDGNVSLPYSRFLGYKKGSDGKPEIVEEEARVIRRIYEMFLDGSTTGEIARALTADNIPTPAGKEVWCSSTVNHILQNEKYKGDALRQKTYTVDFLTKEVRKNDGERAQYLIEHSHDPIIDPEVFDRVQEEIARRYPNRHKLRTKSPFSCKLVCEDCGGYFGHKVWHNHANTERYDVWYCNQRYGGDEKCQTPTLKESEIKHAFERLLRELHYDITAYTDREWRKLVNRVVISKKREFHFELKDGKKITIAL